MKIPSKRAVVGVLVGLAVVSALGVSAYTLRAKLAAAPVVGRIFGGTVPVDAGDSASQAAAKAPVDPPATAGAAADPRAAVNIDPRRRQLIGVRTVPVARGNLRKTVRTVGLVRYDETRLADVNLKLEGWIDELYVDYTGRFVRQGEPLFTLYSPELVTTENEYLLALETRDQVKDSQVPDARAYADRLVELARRRLVLWDLPADQLKALEERREAQTTVTFRSPVNGFVIEKQALKGLHVQPGMSLYKVADLSVVWIEADLYEQEMPFVRLGERATVTLDAYPGERFAGRAIYIYPYVEERTRTVRVRFEFPNPRGRLRPGMYANAELTAPLGGGLVIPGNALLDSGTRQIVFVSVGDGYFEPRAVKAGQRLGDDVQILEGLKEGEEVATGATFFLDSESQLRASLQGFEAPPAAAAGPGAGTARARLQIVFRSRPDPPQTGDNTFEVTVKDLDGKPVTDADVTVAFFMPAMPTMNMPAMRSEAKLAHAGDGTYRGPGQVLMAGRWEVSVVVSRSGQRIGTQQLTVVAP
jgi:RND family efflux transporter MFP subunit